MCRSSMATVSVTCSRASSSGYDVMISVQSQRPIADDKHTELLQMRFDSVITEFLGQCSTN